MYHISKFASRIVVLAILLHISLSVCDGFSNKHKYSKLLDEPLLESSSLSYTFDDLQRQCRIAHFVPVGGRLNDGDLLNPEFLHYIELHVQNHMEGGLDGRNFRRLCVDAKKAGFPSLMHDLEKARSVPEEEEYYSRWASPVSSPNYFFYFLALFRRLALTRTHLPLEVGTPNHDQFLGVLKSRAETLLHEDVSALKKLLDDGNKVGYGADVSMLEEHLKRKFPDLYTKCMESR